MDEKEEDGLIDDYSELRETSPQCSIVGEGQVGGATVAKAKFDVMEALKKTQVQGEGCGTCCGWGWIECFLDVT